MPIDKGGRHLFNNRKVPYQESTNSTLTSTNPLSSFVLCQPISFHYICVLSIRSSDSQINELPEYILENRQSVYVAPLSGKILSAVIFPNDVVIELNGKSVDSVIGLSITEGDRLMFLKNENASDLNIQLVVRCPLERDE